LKKTPFLLRYQAIGRWLPAIFFAVVIFLFSATPEDEVQQSLHRITSTVQAISPTATPAKTASAPTPPAIDWLKVAHGIGYFCLGFSGLYALPAHSRWSPSFALILCCLYAITDEFHQTFTPGRTALARDVLLDTLAALAGVAMMLGVMAGDQPHPNPPHLGRAPK